MSNLIEKLRKNSTIKQTALLPDSKVYGKKDIIQTDVPMINVALSGKLDGGMSPGLLTIAGKSKHFKSAFTLLMAASFQKKYPEGVVLFYDSEFGTPQTYMDSFGVDTTRLVHTPVVNIEELKFDITKQLNNIEKGDKIFIAIDSIGNLASVKEADDALEGKSVADMTRAKQLKSLFRIITPHLNLKDICMVVVNHVYDTQETYSKAVVSGGTGGYYSSNDIWIIGRQQEKDGGEVSGYNFIINIEKSRNVEERSKIPINVTFKGGINKQSGLFDLALESGHLIKPNQGWYNMIDFDTGEVIEPKCRAKDIMSNKKWFENLLKDKHFKEYVENKYRLKAASASNEDIDINEE